MVTILTIGGLDPQGAAGVALDLRVIQGLGAHGSVLITAVTIQNSFDFQGAEPIQSSTLLAQWALLREKFSPAAIKLGMIADESTMAAVASIIHDFSGPVVCDPVMAASAGPGLWTKAMTECFVRQILPRVDLVTPNRPEAQALSGISGNDAELAAWFLNHGAKTVVIKGGHGSDTARDWFADHRRSFALQSPRLPGEFRGTGCFLATAAAVYLGTGQLTCEAVVLAKARLNRAMAHPLDQAGGRVLPMPEPGKGFGPEDLPCVRELFTDGRILDFAPVDRPIGVYPIVSDLSEMNAMLVAGIKTLQLRNKSASGDELRRIIKVAIDACRERDCRLYINDHWQLAIELGAYGVHLGQEDLDHADLAAIAEAGLRLGISTHCYFEARRAQAINPSYLALGPIFATTAKPMPFEPQGIEKAFEWVKWFGDRPIVAIGGIKHDDLEALAKTGISGVAVISDILRATDPKARALAWMNAWGRHSREASSL